MLDADTKRRIDTARDILVGKVPDPKSQVEQITIALIYKFMDDIDAESEEWGGEREFFAGDFSRYGWTKLMHPGMGGHETLNLYAEAITRMPENPGIPPLFRDIFNNAYLPYRDPETLRAFLKVIDEFSYDHSERLGDAFEYLLSVLGSQGDAGQFRTPRHIIDFIVAVLDPKKDDVVLDPACGTAGFLISSYKHIMAANSGEDGHGALTPDERGRLADNFRGYDISPDMVRLSLVNMYLHGFAAPHIFEYDTLTSEDRWNEYADVILANPPFMSPKGGIRPHNRFSVKSKRSEALFVDYMAEHLTTKGRAGVIVPEGIIFQSQTAYRQLRKMLVEDYLVAVVSLPSGVFNPYSGVKTSILFLDRVIAKQTDVIGFFKVVDDGFDLGAQRRPIERNDLPKVQAELDEYLRLLRMSKSFADLRSKFGQVVEKERIAADGEYNLSGERYKDNEAASSAWAMVSLGETVEILDSVRRPITKSDRKPGPYPYYGATGVLDHVESYLFDEPLVLVGEDGAKWGPGESTAFGVDGKVWVNNHAHVLRPRRERVVDTFLVEVLNQMDLTPYITGVTVPKLNQARLKSIQIPLPQLEVQRAIVAEIEGYQRVIDGARAVVESYRPHIVVDPEWPLVAIKEIADVTSSKRILAEEYVPVGIPFYRTKEVVELSNNGRTTSEYYISQDRFRAIQARFGAPSRGDILVSAVGTIGTTWVVPDNYDFYFKDGNLLWIKNIKGAYPNYLKHSMDAVFSDGVDDIVFGAAYKALTIVRLKEIKIPLPSLETQQAIAAEMQAEQSLVNGIEELIRRFEGKVQEAISRVWGSGRSGATGG